MIIADLKETLLHVTKRMRNRKNGPSPEMVSALSKLVNSLRKLEEQRERPKGGSPSTFIGSGISKLKNPNIDNS